MGDLVPVGALEVLPGDTFRHATSALIRFSPLVTPVMHPVHVKIHHWFVPNRLMYDDWEGFITGSDSEAVLPTVTQDGNSDLLDHLGVDPSATGTSVLAFPVRAYNKVWNTFYRDQDLDTEVNQDQLSILKARWEKDYFTTARPAPQDGAAVQIPFSAASAPVVGTGDDIRVGRVGSSESRVLGAQTAANVFDRLAVTGSNWTGNSNLRWDDPGLEADLSQATGGINVSDFRVAMALQRFSEARSRFGSRYVDYLRYHGIRPSDGRLDRPEYLGGGRQTVSFSEVLATAEGASTVVGQLSGHGIAAIRSRPYRRFFEEHGWVLSLLVVRPRAIYGQALNRALLRSSKEDYWQKELEIVG